MQDYVRSIFPDQREDPLNDPAPPDATGIFLDLHSYSELVLWPWGFTQQVAPNGPALQTLGRKFAFFNDYTPQQAIELYPTDGTTDDFGYGDLGLAAYTFELGTEFFQACSTFENTILPDNLEAMLYAVKSARTPYLTPAGPDALGVALSTAAVEPGQSVTLSATLDDTRFNNQNGSEPTQPIAAAEYYVDVPPWSGGTPIAMTPADGLFNSTVEGATATVDSTGLSTGRHTLFVRGQDSAGNWGAVSAAFLFIIDPAVAPTIQGYVREAGTDEPLAATVSAGALFQTTTDPATGFYQFQVISGTYELTASAPDHAPQTAGDVVAENFEIVQQDFSLSPVCPAFADDIESGNSGWTAQQPWAITTEAAHSPTHSWTESPGGAYGNNRNTMLVSPLLDLSDYHSLTLSYWQICDTESGYDYCRVEVSSNGGSSWSEVATFDGPSAQWEPVSLPVPMLDGQPTARIRFRFTSDQSVVRDGWHVDDILLSGGGAACGEPQITPTASPTTTATHTATSTPSITATASRTPTPTATVTASRTPTASHTPTATATATRTATGTLTATPTASHTPTATTTATRTPTGTATVTGTVSATATGTATVTGTVTATATGSPAATGTATATGTPTATATGIVPPPRHLYLPLVAHPHHH